MEASSPLRFLVVATEWDSAHGGLSTFNREFCTALARFGNAVTCYVPRATVDETKRALDANVRLVTADSSPGIGLRDPLEVLHLVPAAVGDVDVVGHGRVTGPYALVVRDRACGFARYVHFVHMDPKAIEQFKEDATAKRTDERFRLEMELARAASVVAAVGPRLCANFSVYLSDSNIPVHCFLPGMTPSTHEHTAFSSTRCLVLARAEDAELKGIGVAARAVVRCADDSPSDVQLTIRGVEEKDDKRLRDYLNETHPRLHYDLEPFTTSRNEIVDSIRRSSVVLLPSHEEGFGLSALEAIAEGVPVIVTRRSGLAEAIRAHLADFDVCIVDVDHDSQLAERIREVVDDGLQVCERANRLRAAAASIFDWSRSIRAFLDALGKAPMPSTPPPPTSPSAGTTSDPLAPLIARFRAASQPVLSWPQVLSDGEWIERPELETISELLKTTTRPIALLGAAGSGKSALLARLADRLNDAGTVVLAIKADAMPREIDDDRALAEWLMIGNSFVETIAAVADLRPVVVIVDQLDALSATLDVETQRLTTVIGCLNRLCDITNAEPT